MNVDKLLVEAGAYFGGDGINYDRFEPRKFAALVLANTPPQPKEPEQEPAMWVDPDWIKYGGSGEDKICESQIDGWIPFFTTPPQRKPLTDEMRKQMKERCDSMEMRGAFADGWLSAEAAHGIKEKNT